MEKIFDSKQRKVLGTLTVVLLILVCGVVYTLSAREASATPSQDATATPYTPYRDARPSAGALDWENTFGGSGDETAVAMLPKNGEIYVFGNTTSVDGDFTDKTREGVRGFAARLSAQGRTVAYVLYDFTVFKVIPTAAGFAVAGNEGSVAGLYLLDDGLTLTNRVHMPALHVLSACGLYVFDNRYFLFASSRDETVERDSLLLHIYTSGLKLEREKVFSHTYSLTLLDCIPHGDGYLLAAAATYQDAGVLTLARFGTLTAPSYTDIDTGHACTPRAFAPLGDGYAAVCETDGGCELLLLANDLRKYALRYLAETCAAGVSTLLYAGNLYAYEGTQLLELGDDGRAVGAVAYGVDKITDFATGGAAAFVCGVTGDALRICKLGRRGSETISLALGGATRALLCPTEDALLLCADSRAVTADCGDNFGGADVWVARLPL